jgi:hypothetical protein
MFANKSSGFFNTNHTCAKKAGYAFAVLIMVIGRVVTLGADIAHALDQPSLLLFSSADSGPNSGWPGESYKGAAITVWGRNLKDNVGDSKLKVCGVRASEINYYPKIAQDFGPDTRRFE